ncbi:MAG: glutaredoxin family protein [Clostridia bacterium]|nr:glutaredoxin family protein [Clostridia bacterium]
MKEYLSRQGISFTEKDISSDENALEEMGRLAGQTAVPTLLVDGRIIVGFDENRLRKVFN